MAENRKGSLRAKMYLMLVLAIVMVFGYLIRGNLMGIGQTQINVNEVGRRLRDEQSETLRIERERERNNTDNNDFVEKIAREKLGLVMPGEIIFIKK